MAKIKLPAAHLWQERNIDDWNTNTFMAFIKDTHKDILGIPYVNPRGGIMQEKGMLNTFRTTHGNEITREFIEACFKKYSPKPQYPNLTFWFMKTYMEAQNLPPLLAAYQQSQKIAAYEDSNKLSTEEMLDLL